MKAGFIHYALRLLAWSPLGLTRVLGALLGWAYWILPSREKWISRVNIATCLPHLDAAERERLCRASLIQGAISMVEMPGVWRVEVGKWTSRVEPGVGQELMQEVISEGKGVIVVGAHLGSWEVGLKYLGSLMPITALYRIPRQEKLDGMIREGRSRGGALLVPASTRAVKNMLAALRRKEMAGLLADQIPTAAGSQGGVYAPFFGEPAQTMVLVGKLARRTGAPVLFWYMERLPGTRGYRIHYFKAPAGIDDADPVKAATALNKGIEQCIRHCPSQYLWSYKRFQIPRSEGTSIYRRARGRG